ncbi:MAG: hypothetical protein ACK5MI_08805 [Mangrovibacterium sp.]
MKKVFRVVMFLSLLLIGCANVAFSQDKQKVSGIVSDDSGPIPGVTIVV